MRVCSSANNALRYIIPAQARTRCAYVHTARKQAVLQPAQATMQQCTGAWGGVAVVVIRIDPLPRPAFQNNVSAPALRSNDVQ